MAQPIRSAMQPYSKGAYMPAQFGHMLKTAIKIFTQINREKATGMLDFELKELENIFALLILGGFRRPTLPAIADRDGTHALYGKRIDDPAFEDRSLQDPLGVLMGMLEID